MEMTSYEPGSPSWVDLSTPDIADAVRYYSGLFGWNPEDQGEEAGHYTMFKRNGKNVCAASPKRPDDPGPPAWTTYFTVDDADATAQKITANNGTVLAAPFDVFDAGRMAVAMDPTGGVFAIWQPNQHIGAQLIYEPNTLGWNELTTRDVDRALAFYTAVFGWTIAEHGPPGAPVMYREIQVGDRTVAGCMEMDDKWPAEVPTHWMVYFVVDDCDAMAAKMSELGGTVMVPPTDIEPGRFAMGFDPQGAAFSVIRMGH